MADADSPEAPRGASRIPCARKIPAAELLPSVSDVLNVTSLPEGDGDNDRADRPGHFVTIRSAQAGEVFRGVAFAPNRGDEATSNRTRSTLSEQAD
jgi:hypothetical protein